jgi:hypothetical protein
MEASARVVVEGDPPFETIARGDIFLDTYPPTGARAMAGSTERWMAASSSGR